MSVFLYAMREREMILDIFEMGRGALMTTYIARDYGATSPTEFEDTVRILDIRPRRSTI
jgi:NADH:ubiquinone oxidoreductase subunit D